MNKKINIGIAEDHEIVRDGFVSLLNTYAILNILFDVSNGKELLKKMKEFVPDIVLLDIEMPILDGRESIEKIKIRYPQTKIIVMSAYSEDSLIIDYVKRGADSFLPKHCKKSTLFEAICTVYEHGKYFEKDVLDLLAINMPEPEKEAKEKKLTSRDLEFVKYLSQGREYSEIATIMGIVEKTLVWYKHKLLLKTGSKSLKELISYVRERNLI